MPLKGKRILVFCSSSDSVSEVYRKAAAALGQRLALEGCELVFGGTDTGTMGVLARAAQEGGAPILGVIPEKMHLKGMTFKGCAKVLVSRDLHERKTMMQSASDMILCLPGGVGSLDELADAMALKQLRYNKKPIILINIEGYFDPLLDFFEKMRAEGFSKPESRSYLTVVSDAGEAFEELKRML